MIFVTAALVFTLVLVGLALFLSLSERYLVAYGACKISVNEGERTLEVQGGKTLLTCLTEAEIAIPSACGGKGSCGYCKVIVKNGGGPLLATEAPYLSRTERRRNFRLACQVKVRNDMDIAVPDFLSVIKTMVTNRTYNPNQKWRFIIE